MKTSLPCYTNSWTRWRMMLYLPITKTQRAKIPKWALSLIIWLALSRQRIVRSPLWIEDSKNQMKNINNFLWSIANLRRTFKTLRKKFWILRKIQRQMKLNINSKILKKSKSYQSIKSQFQFLLKLSWLPFRMRTLKNISHLLRPFGHPPIGGWSLNLSGINSLKQDSRGSMMLTLMGGILTISTGIAIRRDGLWL
jgi:hypothetical protein